MEEEEVPIANFKDMLRKDWIVVRKLDPYWFVERTCDRDDRFWTRTQFKLWNEFYMTLADKVVKPKLCDEEYLNEHKNNGLKHIYATLENMNILKLAMIYQSYCPELISQFYCAIFFHNNCVRTMTWMSGDTKFTNWMSNSSIHNCYVFFLQHASTDFQGERYEQIW